MRSQIITAKQGAGDETDRGLCFYEKPVVVRVRLGRF